MHRNEIKEQLLKQFKINPEYLATRIKNQQRQMNFKINRNDRFIIKTGF